MKRIRAHVDITRRTAIEFEVDDDLDDEEMKTLAIEEVELAEWEDDLPEVGILLRCWRSRDPRRTPNAPRSDQRSPEKLSPLASGVVYPRPFYTDLDTSICKNQG
jgi:hypothetical protein